MRTSKKGQEKIEGSENRLGHPSRAPRPRELSEREEFTFRLVEGHTDGALLSYAVAASSFLPPFARASKIGKAFN